MNHAILLQIGAQGVPPREFRLFAMGDNATSKGTFTLDDESAADVIAEFAAHGMDKMPIDFDHGMLAGPMGNKKAAGWADLEARSDGLWAVNVEWTPAAEQALKDREFRFVSPAFKTDDKKRIIEMANVALTNLPATRNALPIVAHDAGDPGKQQAPDKGKEIEPMSDKLFKLLGASDEGEALVIASEINTLSKALLKVTGATSLDGALAAIEANAALPAEIVELSAKLSAYESANLTRDRDALIETLSKDGKLPPALHTWAKTQTLESLNTFGQSAPVLGAVATPAGTPPTDNTVTLSAEDEYMLAQFGIETEEDKAKWLAVRKEEQAKKAKG